MKKFMMVTAAVLGISGMGLGATAQAGGPGYNGHGYQHGHSHRGYYGGSYGRGYNAYRPPVYRAPVYAPPVYGVPVYGGYPVATPAYPYYGGTSFGISTPNFGLFIR